MPTTADVSLTKYGPVKRVFGFFVPFKDCNFVDTRYLIDHPKFLDRVYYFDPGIKLDKTVCVYMNIGAIEKLGMDRFSFIHKLRVLNSEPPNISLEKLTPLCKMYVFLQCSFSKGVSNWRICDITGKQIVDLDYRTKPPQFESYSLQQDWSKNYIINLLQSSIIDIFEF